ncbi:MAG: hypothetical protein M3075_12585 [Candidatus Dormibacteraeota bacterium]|nr:hypothetical protein [Candidatus Dormibacteraeota bacterium]
MLTPPLVSQSRPRTPLVPPLASSMLMNLGPHVLEINASASGRLRGLALDNLD